MRVRGSFKQRIHFSSLEFTPYFTASRGGKIQPCAVSRQKNKFRKGDIPAREKISSAAKSGNSEGRKLSSCRYRPSKSASSSRLPEFRSVSRFCLRRAQRKLIRNTMRKRLVTRVLRYCARNRLVRFQQHRGLVVQTSRTKNSFAKSLKIHPVKN